MHVRVLFSHARAVHPRTYTPTMPVYRDVVYFPRWRGGCPLCPVCATHHAPSPELLCVATARGTLQGGMYSCCCPCVNARTHPPQGVTTYPPARIYQPPYTHVVQGLARGAHPLYVHVCMHPETPHIITVMVGCPGGDNASPVCTHPATYTYAFPQASGINSFI